MPLHIRDLPKQRVIREVSQSTGTVWHFRASPATGGPRHMRRCGAQSSDMALVEPPGHVHFFQAGREHAAPTAPQGQWSAETPHCPGRRTGCRPGTGSKELCRERAGRSGHEALPSPRGL